MYSPHALKLATAIMYERQLIHRAKTLPMGDLEKEISDYEARMVTPDRRSFMERFFDYWLGEDNFRFDEYQVNKRVLREREK